MKDVVLVGSSMKEGMTVTTHKQPKGARLGFDAAPANCSGPSTPSAARRARQRHLAPDNSWAINGNVGIWTQISVDEAGPGPSRRNADVGLLWR